MPFDGSGNYVPPSAPTFPAVTGTTISSTYFNAVINDIGTALQLCITRDGQGKPVEAIDWNGKDLTDVGNLTATTVNATNLNVSGTPTLAGLTVTGTATLAGVNASGTIASSGGGFLANGSFNVDSSVPVSYSAQRTGQVAYHLYNGGGVCEWIIYQPVHATDDNFHIAKVVGGVVTDFLTISPSGIVVENGGISTSGNCSFTGLLASGTNPNCMGFLGVPSNVKTANYNIVTADMGQSIDMNGASLTVTLGTLPDGFACLISNLNASSLTIASGTSTLILSGTTTTGSRTLGQNGEARVHKKNGSIYISGTALS